MFTILNEIVDASLLRLTNTQKAVLVSVFMAQTPALAYESTIGNEYITTSTDFLLFNALIGKSDDGVVITNKGYDVLLSNGLVDESGQPTEMAQTLMTEFEKENQQIRESLIPYRFMRSL